MVSLGGTRSKWSSTNEPIAQKCALCFLSYVGKTELVDRVLKGLIHQEEAGADVDWDQDWDEVDDEEDEDDEEE